MTRSLDIPAIRIEGLSKKYLIGNTAKGNETFREMLMRKLSSPVNRLNNSYRESEKSEFWALKDINLDINAGEVVGIIGKNGAGKSTLLKIISQITEPTAGCIKLWGRVSSLLEVGTGFHAELTGRENIFLNGAIMGMTRNEVRKKFDEIVAFAEIEKFLDTPVKRYSSGMYVRLAFAVAAHLEPDILLVDEVLAVGDTAFQRKCLGKMDEISKGGRTVMFVSHNMVAIRKLCSSAVIIECGKIIQTGATDSVISFYLDQQEEKQKSQIELPPTSDKDAAGQAVCLQFYDQARMPTSYIRIRDPWLIVLEFQIFRPVANVIAAVGLTTTESIPIITYWSEERDLEPGLYRVEFECNIPLNSNEITFSVGLSKGGLAFYYVENAGRVSISEIAKIEQPFMSKGAGLLWNIQSSEIKKI